MAKELYRRLYLAYIMIVLSLLSMYPSILHGYTTPYVNVANKTTIVVPDDYSSITQAIKYAPPGSTILIKPGVYSERFTIFNKYNLVVEALGPVYIVVVEDITFGNLFNITFKNIAFARNKTNLVAMKSYIQVWIERCKDIVFQNTAFEYIDDVNIRRSNNIYFRDVYLGNVSGLDIGESNNIRLERVHNANGTTAVGIHDSKYIYVIDSFIEGGISVHYSDNVYVSDTSIDGYLVLSLSGVELENTMVNGTIGVMGGRSASLFTVTNSTLNGKPIVVLKNIDAGWKRLSDLYDSVPGLLVLYNVSNLFIEGYNVSGRCGFWAYIYASKDIVFKDMILYRFGLYLESSRNITIFHTRFYSPCRGIAIRSSVVNVEYSEFNGGFIGIIFYETPSGNGLFIRRTRFVGQKYGIFAYSSNISIIDTVFIGTGFNPLSPAAFSNISIVNTTVNGRPILFISNMDMGFRRLNPGDREAGEIILYNVSNLVIEGYVFSNSSVGIVMYMSKNIAVYNNSFHNMMDGIAVLESTRIYILYNDFRNVDLALYTARVDSDDVRVFLNNFINVTDFTIEPEIFSGVQSPLLRYRYKGNSYVGRLGNYWDKYHGIDNDGDGVGERKYVGSGRSPYLVWRDEYPLVDTCWNYIIEGLSSVESFIGSPMLVTLTTLTPYVGEDVEIDVMYTRSSTLLRRVSLYINGVYYRDLENGPINLTYGRLRVWRKYLVRFNRTGFYRVSIAGFITPDVFLLLINESSNLVIWRNLTVRVLPYSVSIRVINRSFVEEGVWPEVRKRVSLYIVVDAKHSTINTSGGLLYIYCIKDNDVLESTSYNYSGPCWYTILCPAEAYGINITYIDPLGRFLNATLSLSIPQSYKTSPSTFTPLLHNTLFWLAVLSIAGAIIALVIWLYRSKAKRGET